jgi:hypothetical protein
VGTVRARSIGARRLRAPGRRGIIFSMETQNTTADFKPQPREWLALAGLSLAAMVLSSLDQCTRGPSLTAILLSNLQAFC